jgi:hypothetical protein
MLNRSIRSQARQLNNHYKFSWKQISSLEFLTKKSWTIEANSAFVYKKIPNKKSVKAKGLQT